MAIIYIQTYLYFLHLYVLFKLAQTIADLKKIADIFRASGVTFEGVEGHTLRSSGRN